MNGSAVRLDETPDPATVSASGAPTRDADRIALLDVLRGIAVLAIFFVNMKGMAAPFAFYNNADLWTSASDRALAAAQFFLIDDKWRTIFTALFGAGLALLAEREGSVSARRIGRRNAFLLAFGLFHLIFIWYGDILTTYALGGFLAMRFRHLPARALLRRAAACLVVALRWIGLLNAAAMLEPTLRAEFAAAIWSGAPADLAAASAPYLGGVGGQIADRAASAAEFLGFYFLLGGRWLETLGIMLAGMWALKAGFLKGEWTRGAYGKAAAFGLALAFLIDAARWTALELTGWRFETFLAFGPANAINGYAGAVGYAGLVAWGLAGGWRAARFAAAGKMAFTNYIACSLIGTSIAYGHAGGLFGAMSLAQMTGVVLASCALMLWWSPLWLRHFRFGPLEWAWRSLTYGAPQKLRRVM